MWEAMSHTWPDGSVMMPERLPQNWSVTSAVSVAPASTAAFTVASTSST